MHFGLGHAWHIFRNQKRDLARAARRLAMKEERLAERRARSEQATKDKAIRAEERLQLQEEAREAREARARRARARPSTAREPPGCGFCRPWHPP